ERVCFNGYGGVTAGGRGKIIDLPPGSPTPAPWGDVISNGTFRTGGSERGLGVSWRGHSQADRLGPGANDTLSRPQSEAIYIEDADNGTMWTPTPRPVPPKVLFRVHHGHGYSTWEHWRQGIAHELTVFVPRRDPVKVCRLRLRNYSGRERHLRITQ